MLKIAILWLAVLTSPAGRPRTWAAGDLRGAALAWLLRDRSAYRRHLYMCRQMLELAP